MTREAGKTARDLGRNGNVAAILAMCALVLCGGGAYAIGKNGLSGGEKTWSHSDQREYAAQVEKGREKNEAAIAQLITIANTQAISLARLTIILETQDARIKALEAKR